METWKKGRTRSGSRVIFPVILVFTLSLLEVESKL